MLALNILGAAILFVAMLLSLKYRMALAFVLSFMGLMFTIFN